MTTIKNSPDPDLLDKLLSGRSFRNGHFPDSGNRYKVTKDEFGTCYIVLIGSPLDQEGRVSSHYIKEIDGDIAWCGHVYSEMQGDYKPMCILLSELIFDPAENLAEVA